MANRFIPKHRMALDGKMWWYIWDNKTNNYSRYLCHGKHKTKIGAITAIEWANNNYAKFFK